MRVALQSTLIAALLLPSGPADFRAQALVSYDSADALIVGNSYYTASIKRQTGELYSVIDRMRGRTLISGDKLAVRLSDRSEALPTSYFFESQLSIGEKFDFYVRVTWRGTVIGAPDTIVRTYEFTK